MRIPWQQNPSTAPDSCAQGQDRRPRAATQSVFGARAKRRLAAALCSQLICVALSGSAALGWQNSMALEYRAKAAFLVKFLDFVDWPENAFSSARSPFRICVRGEFPFGTSLAQEARGALPHGRPVEVRWLHDDRAVRSCHILFVSGSESKRYAKVLQTVEGGDVLTVGETPDFLTSGGAIAFSMPADDAEEAGLRFEVNLTAVDSAHLSISSRLLAVAKRVVRPPEAKKG